ncbi:MAG: GGDEF domain-containing protein [candidate division WOR-3 bacterium]
MDGLGQKIVKAFPWIFNRSLFWKVGFIVGFCTFVNLVVTIYLYYKLGMKDPVFEVALYVQVFVSFVLLVWGAIGFYYMVKRPLDRISKLILRFLDNQEEFLKSGFSIVKHYAMDEIGTLVEATNRLLENFTSLYVFKHTIENDEDPQTVYERLGWILENKVGLKEFIIYEVSNSQNTMKVVYSRPVDAMYSVDKLFDSNKCRAKRTGEIITNFSFPGICKQFVASSGKYHWCIPMISGSSCVGVVEIRFSDPGDFASLDALKKKVYLAKTYIEEATPVIEAKRYAESLKEQTFKDALTGLYNRRFLEAMIDNLVAQITRRESVLGILMCDLDFFKSVNDKYGHDAGDLVLKQTAEILKNNVRKSDFVIRFGGEEFLILLVDVSEGKSLDIAEKLRKEVEIYDFKIPQGIVKRTISIGVSEFPIDTQMIWEAIKYADVALYKAKEFGRNRVVRFVREFWISEEY